MGNVLLKVWNCKALSSFTGHKPTYKQHFQLVFHLDNHTEITIETSHPQAWSGTSENSNPASSLFCPSPLQKPGGNRATSE